MFQYQSIVRQFNGSVRSPFLLFAHSFAIVAFAAGSLIVSIASNTQTLTHSLTPFTNVYCSLCPLSSSKLSRRKKENRKTEKGDRFYLLVICELWTYVFSHSQRLYPFVCAHVDWNVVFIIVIDIIVPLRSAFSANVYTTKHISMGICLSTFRFYHKFPLILLHYSISTHCSHIFHAHGLTFCLYVCFPLLIRM